VARVRKEHHHRGEPDREGAARDQFEPAERPGVRNALEGEPCGEKVVAEKSGNHPHEVAAEDLTAGVPSSVADGEGKGCWTEAREKEWFGRRPGSKRRDGEQDADPYEDAQ